MTHSIRTLFYFLLLLSAPFTYAQSADEKDVIQTEKQRFDAQVSRNYDVLEKVLANDLVYNHSNGNVDNKQSFIQSLRDGKFRYEQVDVSEQKVRLYGNTAIVNGFCTVKATSNGEPVVLKLRYTDAYVRSGKQWQLITWQSLRLP